MRITIINSSCRLAGGITTYLRQLIAAFHLQGHEVSLFCEHDLPETRERMPLPDGAPLWIVAGLGEERALAALKSWKPEVIYVHGLESPELEARIQQVAPAILFVHAYHGTCISGLKSHQFPANQACYRRFGWPCLLHYFPRRCGGLNPLTMVREFSRQSKRFELLRHYAMILVHSAHMADEYCRHGFAATVKRVAFPALLSEGCNRYRREHALSQPIRLLFLGRMERVKGGAIFLEALPEVMKLLKKPLVITFAGDGTARAAWEKQAERVAAKCPRLQIQFTSWVDAPQRARLYQESDLLVIPSLWPEPFGMVGIEAGEYGLPSVAFNHGGIPEWLEDGVNGCLAPAEPATARGLAAVIVRCLSGSDQYDRLRTGAWQSAQRFTMQNHLRELLPLLESVAG